MIKVLIIIIYIEIIFIILGFTTGVIMLLLNWKKIWSKELTLPIFRNYMYYKKGKFYPKTWIEIKIRIRSDLEYMFQFSPFIKLGKFVLNRYNGVQCKRCDNKTFHIVDKICEQCLCEEFCFGRNMRLQNKIDVILELNDDKNNLTFGKLPKHLTEYFIDKYL